MRLTLPLLLAALTGCAVAPAHRVNTQARSAGLPPLPDEPGREASAPPALTVRAKFVAWTLSTNGLDTLETSQDLIVWLDLAGPYPALDMAGVMSYRVPITNETDRAFFRIRRIWGAPWIITPKIESKTETEK